MPRRHAFYFAVSDPTKAVFLSYASQDAEAAKRIADALRAAGVEVWFDTDGGLEHGDEWDAKIRRQIKECVLFLPIISANTQAREEGYFRIEWELAAERAMGIASGTAFILPIVIDDTREATALVPDRFRKVQWTKLPGGVVPAEVLAKFVKLWSHRAGMVTHETGRSSSHAPTLAAGRAGLGAKPGARAYVALAVAILAMVAVAGWWTLRRPAPIAAATTDSGTPPVASPDRAAEFPRDPELKQAMRLIFGLDSIAQDFALAEDLVKPVLAARPNDPEVVTVAAVVAQEFLTRGFDTTQTRRAQAQKLAERAVQLAPDNPDALAALGRYLLYISAQLPRAEELLRRAIALQPDEPRYHRMLFGILAELRPGPETEAFGARMAVLFPTNVLVRYDLARGAKDRNDLAGFERELDATLAIAPLATALVWKSWLMLSVHGDVAGMRAWLDRVPERLRQSTRFASALSNYAAISGETGPAIDLLNDLPDTWLTDFDFTGPKALLLGDLLTIAGRKDLARLQYEAAFAEIKLEKTRSPTDLRVRRAEFWTLLGLGQRDEAHAVLRIMLDAQRRPYLVTMNNSWWSGPVRASLLLGERGPALALLTEAASEPQGRIMLRNQFKVDPRMAPFRADPEITALLAEPAVTPSSLSLTPSGPPAADQKSVAVLAFANLSDDKGNEYFSDGISEELLNVLAKIPGLKVSARTSAFYFKGKEVPIPEIAQKLGVAYVVEGSVRKAGDKVRITAQLIKAADGFHVWSDTFTRDLKDIFAVQDEIAGLIAQQLQLKLGETGAKATVDPAIYELLLQARALALRESNEDWRQAIGFYRRALEREPRLAVAWAEMARTYVQLGRFGGLPITEGMREARQAAQRALELQPDQATGLTALGWVQRTADWDWRGARRSFQRALELAPGNSSIMSDAAVLYFNIGRVDVGLRLARQAVERDPLNARAQASLGFIHSLNNDPEQCVGPLEKAVALAPKIEEVRRHLSRALMHVGQPAKAEEVAAQEPNAVFRLLAVSQNLETRGEKVAGRKLLDDCIAKYGDEFAGYYANQYAMLGEKELAFVWLDRSLARRDAAIAWIKTNANFRELHSDPRWPVLLRKVGLADDQLK